MEQQKTSEMEFCNLSYLEGMVGGKKHLILEIMDAFLAQIPEELKSINDAVNENDFSVIRRYAHTMKSSVSIMGISALTPVLQEMENLSALSSDMDRISQLNTQLNELCSDAIAEIVKARHKYL